MRLIKGQISYFDGQVISGKKEGNGKMYVRSDDYFHWDYVNDVNVQSGSVIQGFWINNKLEGKANITWSNGVSEEVLFKNNVHQGSFKIVDNKTQICLYDGKSFDSHFKKTDEEIQQEKLATKSIRINAYKTETFCSSNCERNAINALSQNSNSQGSSAKTQQNNSGPKWECSNCLTNSYAVSQPSVTLRGCNSSDGRHSWLKVDSNAPKWECNKCLTHSFRESQPSVTLRGCNSSDGRHLWLKVDSNAPKWECNKCLTHSYGASQPSNTLKGCTSSDGRHWWVKTN
jgi:ribosomal protein L24E